MVGTATPRKMNSQASNGRSRTPRITFELVKGAAVGRWQEIYTNVFGIGPEYLTGKHGPCPICMDGTKRWRVFGDFAQTGGAICNDCARNLGDGFKVGAAKLGREPKEVLQVVAEYLGLTAQKNSSSRPADPAKDLVFEPWPDDGTEFRPAYWCLKKPPIVCAALRRCGARIARYRREYTVLALPIWGQQLTAAEPVGWCLYEINGRPLPKWEKNVETSRWEISEWLKVKITWGSKPGIIGPVDELRHATEIYKLEGPSDLLSFYSLPDLPPHVAAITNANGCGEKPQAWMLDLFRGKTAAVLHDADQPGQAGATNWAEHIALTAAQQTCANVTLPYEVSDSHGKDLRDWCGESPRAYADLAALPRTPVAAPAELSLEALQAAADKSASIDADGEDLEPNEAADDPHRLAVVNLERYAELTDGGTVVFWRDEWYVYKHNKYRKIPAKELESKVAWSIKEEFNRINIEAQKSWLARRREAVKNNQAFDEERPEARKVTKSLVANVLQATASISVISGDIKLNSQLSSKQPKNWIAMLNGIVDVDAFLDNRDISEVLLPHSSDWFSVVCLPYNFDPGAKCPKWLAFLYRCMNGDKDLVSVLQEWAGYLLLPDTSQQKFLVNEGEGGNGKSVYMAGIEAMLGVDNCSHVALEKFSGQFDLTETLGKLANICGDMGEIDKIGEGHLKSFTGGDRMLFNRKNLTGINCAPTARLMFNTNNRPRFSDKSSGIWRRILLIPWKVTISKTERVLCMDKIEWWQEQGELPGIFIWAIKGLHRLRMQKAFTFSQVIDEAIASYRQEVNPTREFLLETCQLATNPSTSISSSFLYSLYRKWMEEHGNQPTAATAFGREIHRVFPTVNRERKTDGDRGYRYLGLKLVDKHIQLDRSDDYTLFDDDSL